MRLKMTEFEYNNAMAEISRLMDCDPAPNTPDGIRLLALTKACQECEGYDVETQEEIVAEASSLVVDSQETIKVLTAKVESLEKEKADLIKKHDESVNELQADFELLGAQLVQAEKNVTALGDFVKNQLLASIKTVSATMDCWLFELSQMRDFSRDTSEFAEKMDVWLNSKLKDFDKRESNNVKGKR